MTRILIAAAALSLVATPALARDKEVRTFKRDGITYTYTSTRADDVTVLEGRAHPLGGNFRLVIKDGQVRGYAGGANVDFPLSEVKRTQVAQD